jgi:hypothetical protein
MVLVIATSVRIIVRQHSKTSPRYGPVGSPPRSTSQQSATDNTVPRADLV